MRRTRLPHGTAPGANGAPPGGAYDTVSARAYEAAFARGLVGGDVSWSAPFSGAEPLLRRLHPVRNIFAVVLGLRLGRSGSGRPCLGERDRLADSCARSFSRRASLQHAG